MIFSQDRDTLRRMYIEAWQKQIGGQPMTPLETQIASVVGEHPEYHSALDLKRLEHDYLPEQGRTNPFLHMGLHLAIREQVATDRPNGIRGVHTDLCRKHGDAHSAEHRMIDALAETLWEAQGQEPDEGRYIERLRAL
ncbi:MAG: DUF1841 family protein [Pseudomonadota bacterium]